MTQAEGAGALESSGIAKIITKPRPLGTPDAPGAKPAVKSKLIGNPPPDEETTDGFQKPDKPTKQGLNVAQKIAVGAISTVVAAEAGGIGYDVAYDLIKHNPEPVSGHTLMVDALHPWNIGRENTIVLPSPNFDNSKISGVIGDNNWMGISDANQIKDIQTVPATPTPKHDIDLLTPFLKPEQNVNYTKHFSGEGGFSYRPDVIDYAKQHGINDIIIFSSLPVGTVIVAPADGLISFNAKQEGTGTIDSIRFIYTAPDGEIYGLSLSDESGKIPLKPLVKVKPYVYTAGGPPNLNPDSAEMVRGQPIAVTTQVMELRLVCTVWSSGEIGKETADKRLLPANLNLITLPNVQGNKLALLEK